MRLSKILLAVGTVLGTFASTSLAFDAFSVPMQSARSNSHFIVFDGTLYKNKPDFARYGIRPVKIVGGQFWASGRAEEALPKEDRVHHVAHEASSFSDMVILDIEHWSLQGDAASVRENLLKYMTVLRWFRAAEPHVEVGYYGTVPIRDYWRAIKDSKQHERAAWSAENDRLRPLAMAVDALFPSLYTFYEDREGWRKYAIEQIAEARRYGGGKPVYVFLWPQFHDSNRWLRGTYLSADFWRFELDTVRLYADGIVIWGGWGENNRPANWDEEAPWWHVTKEFMRTIPRTAMSPSDREKGRP